MIKLNVIRQMHSQLDRDKCVSKQRKTTWLIPYLGDVFVSYNLRCHSFERRMLCAINNRTVPGWSDGKRILCDCSSDKNSIILLANSTFLYFYVSLHIKLFSFRFPSPKNCVFIKSSFITRTLYLLHHIIFMRIFLPLLL